MKTAKSNKSISKKKKGSRNKKTGNVLRAGKNKNEKERASAKPASRPRSNSASQASNSHGGIDIRQVQSRLNAKGYGPLEADGVYGPKTEAAVKRFQKAIGLTVDGIVGPKTFAALEEGGGYEPGKKKETKQKPTSDNPPKLIQVIENMGYDVFTDGQVNIIGVRSNNPVANKFDDEIHLIWVEDGKWQHRNYSGTTDPGRYWLENPMRTEGTAILVPDQYPVYRWDLHNGKYKALCQRAGNVKVFRDNNGDNIVDWENGDGIEGSYGINIHHAGTNSTQVDKWSAGCQVFARMSDWDEAVAIWEGSKANLFTYTLITEDDVNASA
jgi:peptidoglycan hydrolase-like protein with peptidoglycan-binding domain